jgi:hypothetical protein
MAAWWHWRPASASRTTSGIQPSPRHAAGFRVLLRYDYYGRGYSDRPDIAYTQDLYVRQLAELLDAVHVSADRPRRAVLRRLGRHIVRRQVPGSREVAHLRGSSFWSPHAVTPIQRMPRVWNYLTAIFEERWWADLQLDDFRILSDFPTGPIAAGADGIGAFAGRSVQPPSTMPASTRRPQLQRVGEHPRPVLCSGARRTMPCPSSSARRLAGGDAPGAPRPGQLGWTSAPLGIPGVNHPMLIAFLRQ